MYANTFKKCSFLAALLSSLTFTVLAHLFIIYLFVCFKCSYLHLMFCFISYCVWNFSGSSRSVVFPPGQVQTGFWGNCRSWISWNAAVECFFMCSQHVGWIIVWLQAFSVWICCYCQRVFCTLHFFNPGNMQSDFITEMFIFWFLDFCLSILFWLM